MGVTHHPVPIEIIGFDRFQPTGSVEYLFDRSGLSAAGIAARARRPCPPRGVDTWLL